MSREAGFSVADTSTSHHDDAKVKAMWRAVQDEQLMNAAMVLHEATRLASWRDGKRVTAQEAAPPWMGDAAGPARALAEAGLLDDDYRIPRATWNQWFGAAKKRREASRERWRRSKQSQRTSTNLHDESAPVPRGHRAESRVPSDRPSDRPNPPARGRAKAGSKDPSEEDRAQAIARAQEKLEDPATSEDVRAVAEFQIRQLTGARA